jgi:hypothetical protein
MKDPSEHFLRYYSRTGISYDGCYGDTWKETHTKYFYYCSCGYNLDFNDVSVDHLIYIGLRSNVSNTHDFIVSSDYDNSL